MSRLVVLTRSVLELMFETTHLTLETLNTLAPLLQLSLESGHLGLETLVVVSESVDLLSQMIVLIVRTRHTTALVSHI